MKWERGSFFLISENYDADLNIAKPNYDFLINRVATGNWKTNKWTTLLKATTELKALGFQASLLIVLGGKQLITH